MLDIRYFSREAQSITMAQMKERCPDFPKHYDQHQDQLANELTKLGIEFNHYTPKYHDPLTLCRFQFFYLTDTQKLKSPVYSYGNLALAKEQIDEYQLQTSIDDYDFVTNYDFNTFVIEEPMGGPKHTFVRSSKNPKVFIPSSLNLEFDYKEPHVFNW